MAGANFAVGAGRGEAELSGAGPQIGNKMKPIAKNPPTQLQQAKLIRDRYKRWFPILDELKQDLGALLDEAQNEQPEGNSDGTICETQWAQLRSIEEATRDLLIALLFDTKADR
jgi:hypothetical protein